MKLINQSAEFLPQEPGLSGIYKQIELAGRTSYLSWDKMTDDSAKKFVDMLIKSKHCSVLEHGTVYLKIPFISDSYGKSWWGETLDHDKLPSPFQKFNIINKPSIKASKYYHNQYSKCHIESTHKRCSPIAKKESISIGDHSSLSYAESCEYKYSDHGIYWEHIAYITTNLRVLQENGWLDDLKYLCEPTEFHEKRLSVKVITDIGVTREFNRHRTFSIVEQSTRYCNFSKDKFNNEITFINPVWDITLKPDSYGEDLSYTFSLNEIEILYKHLTEDCGWSAQQARTVLPLCTKTEVVYTAFESDWRHFFDLRLFGKTGEPHPQIKQLAELIKQEFEKAGVWEGIMKYPSKYE